jgi:uncharacterized protein (DUF1330 family)
MPCAYIIVESKISDPERFKAYMAAAPAAVAAAGGEYLARGGRLAVLEGDWQPTRITMLRFPGFEQAQAFYDGEQYRAARALRIGTTDRFNMILTEGVPD